MTTNSQSENDYHDDASLLERMMFNYRPFVIVIAVLLTLFLGYHMLQMRPDASFLRMIPTYHPFIQNMIKYRASMPPGSANTLRICVATTKDTIFTKEYLDVLQQINTEVFFTPEVFRGRLFSLWQAAARWSEIREDGFYGGPIIASTYDGSQRQIDIVRRNVMNSPYIGNLVANDFKSSVIVAPLLDIDPKTGKRLDYYSFNRRIENLRDRYESEDIKIHITGFAKVVGDLIDAMMMVIGFFFLALVIMLGLLYHNSRSWRVTILRGIKSMMAVIWQLGILHLLGYGLNPYSMLVPFLIFAIGVSHGIQFFNAMGLEMANGADKLKAARLGYRTIYKPGLAALFTDCIGFATLMIIRIGVIQDIAVGASIGIAVVAITDLTVLPVMMSYVGINEKTIDIFKRRKDGTNDSVWKFLSVFTRPNFALLAILIATIGVASGIYLRKDLKTGDLDPGVSEFRPDSRYNRDNAYMNEHYYASSDIFIVILVTPQEGQSRYPSIVATDLLDARLTQVEGVQNVITQVDRYKNANYLGMEGNMKWAALSRSQSGVNTRQLVTPLIVYLDNHMADTLERVVDTVAEFAEEYNTEAHQFLMAGGPAGIQAATNIEVEKALILLHLLVYATVFVVCLVTYRNIRAALCVVTPLALTSVLCEAIMAQVGIGVKVATLPVIAVGVGIGVDYGIYIYNKLLAYRKQGLKLTDAYYHTLNTTGRAVSFTGIVLAIGVGTWVFSGLKFQADMGMLLVFMFLWNMVGAMVLLPALAWFFFKE